MDQVGFTCYRCYTTKLGSTDYRCICKCGCSKPLCGACLSKEDPRCIVCFEHISCGRCGKTAKSKEFITCSNCRSGALCSSCNFDEMCFRCYSQKNRANVQFFKDIIVFQQGQIQQLIAATSVQPLPEEYAEFLFKKEK